MRACPQTEFLSTTGYHRQDGRAVANIKRTRHPLDRRICVRREKADPHSDAAHQPAGKPLPGPHRCGREFRRIWQTAPISEIGLMVPISLLAWITETIAVVGRIRRGQIADRPCRSESTGRYSSSNPCRSASCWAVRETA